MNIILTDHQERDHLLPLTYTRPVAKLRVGLFTIEEKWQRMAADATISFKAQDYMSKVFPEKDADDNLYVNGAAIPTIELIQELIGLADGESLYQGEAWIATRSASKLTEMPASGSELNAEVKIISRSWRIFQWNGEEITSDLALVRNNGSSAAVPDGVTLIGDDIFIEEGATLRPCTINTETGPVYIGKNAEVMEGSLVRGPFALMNDSVLKMGAKIYGATTIGPHSKVGGEVNNCVI
ncbi:MAG: glucose-1-phosphate thymidylyltransferase, partial [Flavobacteriales bacterium]|nr:glucose-1-phosphate thymidylyltransferase [Flavobacteriales bacterium]